MAGLHPRPHLLPRRSALPECGWTRRPPNAVLAQPFKVAGWALDLASTTGTGVDTVHVWAYPNPGSGQPAIFIGAATYGNARPDVATAFGSARFTNSGFSLTVDGLQGGAYQFVAFAFSTVAGGFNNAIPVTVQVLGPLMSLDTPPAGGTTIAPVDLAGWATDSTAPAGTGVDVVHVYAYPNPGSSQAPIFLGAAGYGLPRQDVANAFGARFKNSGYLLTISSLPAGHYNVAIFAHSVARNAWTNTRSVDLTLTPGPQIAVDVPSNNQAVGSGFSVSGWAIDLRAPSGSGVDSVFASATPTAGGSAVFLGNATLGVARPDVANFYGARAATSGFALATAPLPPGQYRILIWSHSVVTHTWNNYASRIVTVH